jgi:pimeloyl-ACP methyl ester carboxylesterase
MKWFTALFLSLAALTARADVAVLIHGYLGSAASWERSGVTQMLHQAGWQPAGVLTPRGVLPLAGVSAEQKFYTVELPSIEPVILQARILREMLNTIGQRHPQDPIILVGHSAGGVVARTTLVLGGIPETKALITIASPHLGTLRAVEALDKTDDAFPFSVVKSFFAGDLYDVVRDSWGVLLDLTPERPGNLLFWLNRQPHPEISYLSIIRPGPVGMGDELVPAFSQDMNRVPMINRKAKTLQTPLSHFLHPMDGKLLAEHLSTL